MPGPLTRAARTLRRVLAPWTVPDRPVRRMDADGWTLEPRQPLQYTPAPDTQERTGPDPFRGLTAPDPVFGWRREP